MLKTQLDAIHDLPLFAAARSTDPPTSQAAAARAPVRGHCRLILEALAAGPAGQTEIAKRTGLTVAAVSKRLPDLRREDGSSGQASQWRTVRASTGGR